MALTFGGATSDRVSVGTTNLCPGAGHTVLAWVRYTTLTALKSVFCSRNDATNVSTMCLRLDTGTSNLRVAARQVTTSGTFTTNDSPISANVWTFCAYTYDQAVSPRVNIYSGTLTAAVTLRTLGTSTDGSGNLNAETNGNNLWGNFNGGGGTINALQGQMAWGMTYNRVLTLGELRSLQFMPRILSGCTNYIQFGYNGTGTQPDWSGTGNAGTITGAALTPDHVPLGPFLSDNWFSPYKGAVSQNGIVYLGSSKINQLYLGATQIKRAYLGTKLVYKDT